MDEPDAWPRFAVVQPLQLTEAVLVVIFIGQRDVPAALVEVLAPRRRKEPVSGITVLGNSILSAQLQSFEVALQDEVDDA